MRAVWTARGGSAVERADARPPPPGRASPGAGLGWCLWQVRGVLLDRVVGGPGNRGRPDRELRVDDPVDGWRVETVEPGRSLTLVSEQRMPGTARMTYEVHDSQGPDTDRSRLVQRLEFRPDGRLGQTFWWVELPAHKVIFRAMLVRMAGRPSAGPGRTARWVRDRSRPLVPAGPRRPRPDRPARGRPRRRRRPPSRRLRSPTGRPSGCRCPAPAAPPSCGAASPSWPPSTSPSPHPRAAPRRRRRRHPRPGRRRGVCRAARLGHVGRLRGRGAGRAAGGPARGRGPPRPLRPQALVLPGRARRLRPRHRLGRRRAPHPRRRRPVPPRRGAG
ncbi:DUF2867 domain-containing protein [Ornithinimicrobium kibberense]|uniref:DUF2867 domain-containing protein n=1 Tax=Ornithinimicrobium kibberense TaxID=282060 RepID=UPI00360F9495